MRIEFDSTPATWDAMRSATNDRGHVGGDGRDLGKDRSIHDTEPLDPSDRAGPVDHGRGIVVAAHGHRGGSGW